MTPVFKKLLAASTALVLALGMVALSVAPAGATDLACPPATVVDGTVTDGEAAADCLAPTVEPAPVADVTETTEPVVPTARTTSATRTAAPVADPTPYVLVAWAMPTWVDEQTATYRQTIYLTLDLSTRNLNALDSQLTQCGTQYQVDLYLDSAITADVIAGGILHSYNNPKEDFVKTGGQGPGKTYKLIHNAPCDLTDAVAAATPVAPTCEVNGSVGFTILNATWDGPADLTVGTHTRYATALSGHTFPGGSATTSAEYTIVGQLDPDGPDCFNPEPVKPDYQVIEECGEYGSITLVNTAKITYAITSGDGIQGLNTVTATAVAPYVFAPSTITSWVIDLGEYTDCVEPSADYQVAECSASGDESGKAVLFTFDNSLSSVEVEFTIPTSSVAVTVPAGAVATRTVTVSTAGSGPITVYANGAVVLVTGAITPFLGCVGVTVTADPYPVPAECTDTGDTTDGAIWVDLLEGVAYTITGGPGNVDVVATEELTELPAGTYLVTATALPGYVLTGEDEWEVTIAAPDEVCIDLTTKPLVVPIVTVSQLSCAVGGSYTLSNDLGIPGALTWTVNGAPVAPGTYPVSAAGSYVIEATAVGPDYGFAFGTQTQWPLIFAESAICDLQTLALTGPPSSAPWWLFGAALLVALGIGIVSSNEARLRREAGLRS
jgi:hypothetical protein